MERLPTPPDLEGPESPAAELLRTLGHLRVWTRGSEHAPHKPLLVLLALARVRQGLPRLVEFREIEDPLRELIELATPGRRGHPEYPFWRLQADGIWEVPDADTLASRASNFDPPLTELRDRRVQGGLKRPIFEALRADPELILAAVRAVAALLPSELTASVLTQLGWPLTVTEAPTAIDVPYADVASSPAPTVPSPSDPDPDLYGRGFAAHQATQSALANLLRSNGVEPRSPAAPSVAFDLLWRCAGRTFVAEVKSLTVSNEERQLRLGLGQVLRYRHAVQESGEKAIAVLVVEREPSDPAWSDICEEGGVRLVWPAIFGSLLVTEQDLS